MDFYEVLDQVIDLLRNRGRVSYRALQRQFDLDDNYVEDLKVELIDVQELATDRDNKMLVWAGESEGTSAAGDQSVQTLDPSAIDPGQPVHAKPPLPAPHTPEAERRQLTVMFCDLTDSTRLSGQLDPEDLRDVIRAYQATSAEEIERYGGYIAQHLGDGLMVYFGWPQAHEDDARRAAHAGLGIIKAMGVLNASLEQEKGIRLAMRIGIHTGLVVVGEVGKGASQEHLALGETPNVASRIEGIAERDTVALSGTTYQLVQGYFVCEALGRHTLKGMDAAQQVYRVVRESDVESRFDIAATRGLTSLVGRDSETALLLERWEQVKGGQGQAILLSGEAGIGKSRLLQVLRDHITDAPHIRLECHSSPYYQNTALYPITGMLQRMFQWQQDDGPQAKLDKLEQTLREHRLALDEAMPLFANVLSLTIPEGRYPPLTLSPQRQRQKTLETIVTMLLQQAEEQPVLFILEDLHWIDPSTLELLDLLIDQTPTTPILTLLTCRPTFQPTWRTHSYLTQMTLNRLSQNQIEDMVERAAGGKKLPDEILQQIVEKTDGVPLFVEEMTKVVLESGHLKEGEGTYELAAPLTSLTIPSTLQDSLMSRLDRLMTAKVIAQLGAVIGRQFSYELLHAVAQIDEPTLQRELARLVETELVYQRGVPPQATYMFKHALVVDAAYESLLKSTRQQYHQRIAQVLEMQFPETMDTQPELLAHHLTQADRNEQAIGYWHKAGQNAIQHSAHAEAINHLNKGLDLLQRLPETMERNRQALALHIALGNALIAAKGHAAPEVGRIYSQARQLCQQVGETPQLFPTLYGLWVFNVVRGNLHPAYEFGEELIRLAQPYNDSGRLTAHRALGWTLLLQGDLLTSQEHFEQLVTLYDSPQHRSLAFVYGQDHGTVGLSYGSWVLWLRGYPDQALQRSQAAITLAQDLSHPLSLAYASGMAAMFHQMRRESQATLERAEAVITLSNDLDILLWRAWGAVPKGWVLAEQGGIEAGIDRISWGMDTAQSTGAELFRPYFLGLLAEAYGKIGQSQEGCTVLAEALVLADRNEERYYEAELHRLKGQLLLQASSDKHTEAEVSFQKALAIARRQQAKSWELRAATSLARLWQSQGKGMEAYDLLAPLYGWFTEGFDTADLKDAKALLDELV